MKKYILFFISIGIILGAILIYNVSNVEKSKKETFSESGYILNGSSNRYYFYQDETYTTSYNKQIVFYDTEGTKVTIDNSNFIHYTSGNIVALQQSVLLDLSKINDNPIVYYDIAANKEIKKISNRYSTKNLDKDLQFEQAIWKVSQNKYIILGNKIKITLNNGMTKDVDGYVEIEYSDNEIVNIYNQEFSYQTISSNSYIELNNDIKLNLGTKIVSQDDENKMALEDMVIDSNDNVTLVDLKPEKEENKNNETENTNETDENEVPANEIQIANGGQANTSASTSTSTSNSSSTSSSTTVVSNTTTGGSSDNSDEENKITIETPDILYEYVNDNESKVDETAPINEPKFKLENMKITAVGLSGNIQITDDDDSLSKNDDTNIKIINNATGKTVYSETQSYGVFNIPVNIETLMPDTSYTIVASATYIVNEKSYTKNFLYKTFMTSSIGVKIEKESYTDNSLSFSINFSDKLVESTQITLLDADGNEIINRKQTIKNSGGEEIATFDGLTPDTDYIVRISQITYDGIIQDGENWIIDTKCKTLKTKACINNLNYSINKRDGTFTLFVDDVTDDNSSIQSFKYIVYKYTQILGEDGKYRLDYDTENIAYQRETTNKEITVTVGDENSDSGIIRGQYYGFKVIASTYDNEKYVDIESNICGAFALNGSTFPSVKFERAESDYPPTEIRGWLYIVDNDNTVTVDADNPLTVTYYSDVDEGNVYLKRTSLQTDERTTDSDGNEVIKLYIDLGEKGSSKKGLKAETSYTFAVYGTINLKDGNGDYKNTHIGSSIVTTGAYENISANMKSATSTTSAFVVSLNLEGDNVAKEGLSSVNLMLYEGSGDINSGEYQNWTRTITENNFTSCLNNVKGHPEVNSLQELFFDNTLYITPSFIGGGKESSYTEVNYQVIVTATIDGTTYSNKIPIKSADDGNENTGDTTYTDNKTNEKYSAAYIIVKGKGTTVDVPEDYKKLTASAITNGNASRYSSYGLAKRDELDDSTYVGYYVSTTFANTGSLTAKRITYYAWDSDGNEVIDPNTGEQMTKTLDFVNQEKAPATVFELGEGTINTEEEDNLTGLHRGNGYFFSYTVTYYDVEGNELIWPICQSDDSNTYTNKSLKTDLLFPKKQEPRFMMYPKTSNENTITYMYSCSDIDKALRYEAHSTTEYTYLDLSVNGTTQKSNIEVKTDGQVGETIVGTLSVGTTYKIGYTRILNKAQTSTYTLQNLVTQRFEGIVSCNDIQIGNIVYNDSNNPNKIRIQLNGNDVNRAAAATVTLNNGEKQVTTGLLKIDDENGNYINADLLDILNNDNFKDFVNRDVSVSVEVYYDNGKIGFNPGDGEKYATYVNSDNYYMLVEGNNFINDNEGINGKLYEYRFYPADDKAQLGIKDIDNINKNQNGVTVELQYSPSGLKQNDNIRVQKQIVSKKIDEDIEHKINIQNIRLGIKMNSIDTTLSTANIKATLLNPLNIQIDNMAIEIWHSKNKNDLPDWNTCETKIISVKDLENFTLEGLSPAEYYHMRFKYLEGSDYVYTYDKDTTETKVDYQFETLATIGIDNIKVEYVAENYTDKILKLSYSIDNERSNMYEKTKYTFYKKDGKTEIPLTENNIKVLNENANYQIVDGALIVTNPSYPNGEKFDKVTEQIAISPANNVFSMGANYVLKITPIVTIEQDVECEIENKTANFTLNALSEPSIGLKMDRRQLTTDVKYIRISVSIKDTDAMIYGKDWGEYTLRVYRYKDDIKNSVEISLYDKSQNGNDITGKELNLKDNSVNFSAYVQDEDIDYSYNYVARIECKYDKQNNGKNLETHTEQYILKAIDNEADVSIGSVALVQNGKYCEIRFYDSYYNIDKIDKIDYSIFNLANNYSLTGSFEPEWSSQNEDQNIIYFKTKLPVEFEEKATYTIKMNLYAGNVLVGQIDTTYIYE